MSRIRLATITIGVLPPDEAEHEDREGDDDDEELGAAALVGGRVLADLLGRQRVAGLQAWIVMCSAPWYWNTRLTSPAWAMSSR